MTRKPTGRRSGPPEKEVNMEQVLHWIKLQATAQEIASSFHVCEDTLQSRLKKHFGVGFSELKKRVDGDAKISLRRYQYKMAEKSATMAIWLGKQWLGQKDREEEREVPLDKNMDFAKLYIEADAQRQRLQEEINALKSKTN